MILLLFMIALWITRAGAAVGLAIIYTVRGMRTDVTTDGIPRMYLHRWTWL